VELIPKELARSCAGRVLLILVESERELCKRNDRGRRAKAAAAG
jgi:hypothetical protein